MIIPQIDKKWGEDMAQRQDIAKELKEDIGTFITIAELARWLGVDRKTVQRRIDKIPDLKPQSQDSKYYWYKDIAQAIVNF